MYTIKANGTLIYDVRLDELRILSATLTKEDNFADNLTFTPSRDNTIANSLKKLSDIIEVFDDGTLIFRGEIKDKSTNFNNMNTFVCAGELSFLNDVAIRPYSWQDGGVRDYLNFLISQYNERVSPERRFVLRKVTVIDANDYIYRSSALYPYTFDEIKEKLLDNFGGHLFLERIDGVTHLDYLEDSPYLSNQGIVLGENILDLSYLEKGADIRTVIIPLGAQIKDEEGSETGDRVTIEEINGGVEYLFDQDAIDQYGWREKEIIFDDVTTPARLKTRGLQELASSISPISSIEVNAIDLRQVGVDVDNVRFLDYVKVSSPPHGIDATLMVTKLTIDLLNKANNTFTIGSDFGSFTKSTSNLETRISTIAKDAIVEKVSDVNNVIKRLWTAISLSETSILQQVSAEYITQTQYGTDIQDISTQLEQTNNSFDFTFTQLNQFITDVNNELQTQFSEQVKYIRFENGSIILGMLGNEMILKQSNDRISFLQSGAEVAYFSDRKLYVNSAEIMTQLTIGKYAFIPRANGNTSWKWIG